MASKARELVEKEKQSGESRVMSSGVEIIVRPFPGGLWEKINARARRDFPDPVPPKKTIEVLGGTEEVDDYSDADYLEKKRLSELGRNNFLGEAILDLCVDLDMSKWQSRIKRIEMRSELYPEDEDDRRVRFLSEYAIRSAGDWQFVFASAVEQTQTTDPEVLERIDSFQRQVERNQTNGASSSSVEEVERLDIQPVI